MSRQAFSPPVADCPTAKARGRGSLFPCIRFSRSPDRFQSLQRRRARAELLRLDAQPLQHADVEVAQGRRVLGVEAQVLPVPEAAAGEQDGEVLDGVAAPVAQVT